LVALRPRTKERPFSLRDPDVVDARLPSLHEAVRCELPQLVPVGAPPLSVDVPRLVPEAHGDAVCAEGPEILAQGVLQLTRPLAGQKRLYLVATGDELITVAPYRVDRVRGSNTSRVAGVPGTLSRKNLLTRCRLREWRQRRARFLMAHGLNATALRRMGG